MQPFKDLHVYQAAAHPRKVYTGMRILVVLASVLVLFQFTHIFNTPVVHAYSCGNPFAFTGHCYGEFYWPGPMQGEKTDIKVEHINCGCNGFLNDELWVQSYSGCSPNCWVEAGIKNENGYGYTFSFWADQRPGGGFNNHYMNAFLSGDFDHDTTFFIFENGTNQFQVAKAIAGVNGCTQFCSNGWVMQSTNNSMSPGYITLGAELAGSSGASSPNIHFTYNYFMNNGSWQPQGAGNPGAKPIVNPPLHAYWVNNQIGGPTGGDWYTYCC